jgi:hypothetical protein
MQLFRIVFTIYMASALVPIIVYVLTRKYQEFSMAYLAVMLVAGFLADGFSYASHNWLHLGINANSFGSIYGYVEYVTVILLYQAHLSPVKKSSFIAIIVSLITIYTIEMVGFRGASDVQSVSMAIFSIVVTVLALAYFFKLMRTMPTMHIYYIPMFWICIGMLVFYTGNFFLYVVRDYLIQVMKDNMATYWSLHNILGIISYIFYSIGMWQAKNSAPRRSKEAVL